MGQARLPPSTKDFGILQCVYNELIHKIESNFFHALMASTNIQGYMMFWMALTSI